MLLLQRIRSKIAEHLSRLGNYTCHVVINRLERAVSSNSINHRDSLELDVAFVGDKELFSRPGRRDLRNNRSARSHPTA